MNDQPWTTAPPVPEALTARIRQRGHEAMERRPLALQAELALVSVFSVATLLWAASAVVSGSV
jgi:hypothetical protein